MWPCTPLTVNCSFSHLDTSPSRLFRTQFRMVSPKRISNPNNTGDSRNCRAGVQINDSGAALRSRQRGRVSAGCRRNGHGYPVSYPAGAPRSFTVLNPWRTGRPACKCVLQRDGADELLDTLQNAQLQSAIVKAMYAATIESELDTQSAMDLIWARTVRSSGERLTGWIGGNCRLLRRSTGPSGRRKVPHLMPGDSLNLQTAQDTDNGYSVLEQSLLRYIAAGLGVSYEQLPELRSDELLHGTGQREQSSGAIIRAAKIRRIPSGEPDVSVPAGRGHRPPRGDVTFKSALQFCQEARSARGNCDWIGSGRMAIDGLKKYRKR
ncbi:phage portal protein [Escherichia coli]